MGLRRGPEAGLGLRATKKGELKGLYWDGMDVSRTTRAEMCEKVQVLFLGVTLPHQPHSHTYCVAITFLTCILIFTQVSFLSFALFPLGKSMGFLVQAPRSCNAVFHLQIRKFWLLRNG